MEFRGLKMSASDLNFSLDGLKIMRYDRGE
jgi:hypothetical protein